MRVVLRVLTLPLAIGVAVFRSRALALLVCLWLVAACSASATSPSTAAESVALPRSWPTARARAPHLRRDAGGPHRHMVQRGSALRYVRQEAPASGGLRSALPEPGPGSLLFQGLRWSSDERFHPQRRWHPSCLAGRMRAAREAPVPPMNVTTGWWTATRRWSSAAVALPPGTDPAAHQSTHRRDQG